MDKLLLILSFNKLLSKKYWALCSTLRDKRIKKHRVLPTIAYLVGVQISEWQGQHSVRHSERTQHQEVLRGPLQCEEIKLCIWMQSVLSFTQVKVSFTITIDSSSSSSPVLQCLFSARSLRSASVTEHFTEILSLRWASKCLWTIENWIHIVWLCFFLGIRW